MRSWITAHAPSHLYLSVISVLEIEIGIGRLRRRDAAQADRLQTWLDAAVLGAFAGRLLSIDLAVARRAAQLHVPEPRPERDALFAATAAVHGLTVVTRHVADFAPLDIPVIDPWATIAP